MGKSNGVSGTKYYVAYLLAQEVSELEYHRDDIGDIEDNPRKYYLDLYAECLKVVSKKDI